MNEKSMMELLKEKTIKELHEELMKINDFDIQITIYDILIEKYDELFKEIHHALIRSNNLYCTDLKEVYEANKDEMFFLDNNELLNKVKNELG